MPRPHPVHQRVFQQVHSQRHAGVTPLPTCSLPGSAGQPQPCHAQLPSVPDSLAVVCSHMDSSDPAASTSTACRSAAGRRQAWSMAACRRVGQLVAETSPAGHHTAVGQAAHIAERVVSAARSQMRRDWLLVGSDIRLRARVLSHWLRGRQPTMTAEVFQSRWCHEEVVTEPQ